MTREELRRACLMRLDECAMEHPLGHQGNKVARYVLRSKTGNAAELMFEKGPGSPPNLWVLEQRVADLLEQPGLELRHSPASTLFASRASNGTPRYGRHSALKPMKQLAHADLICFPDQNSR
ncbi:hypothetical protein [Sediminimonas qiaohouensis]|uniref:hypothetical protein n=1 Tax=Sediminimonas qiaohouensis TaxID=552061 RepID=UPI00041152F3|nr:hypothetical protein [Sediminimonas qiaohouensis]